jgi:chromate transporter
MVAYIRELAVVRNKWLTEQCFKDGVALCQSVPGATAMQTAAYVGLRARGVRGAFAAYLGFGLPAFFLMIFFAALYSKGTSLETVASAFRGLQAIVIALMVNATINFGKASLKNWRDVFLAAASAAALGLSVGPFAVIGAAAITGSLLYWDSEKQETASVEPKNGGRGGILPASVLVLIIAGGLGALFLLRRPLFELAMLMLKVDVLAFGGGFASVPLMLQEVVETKKWLDAKTFMDAIALGQVTPGPIVITATFVGFQIAGLWGAIVGTIAIFSPSFIIVIATVPYLDRLKQSRMFRSALRGPLVAFVGLLLIATVRLGAGVQWNVAAGVVATLAFIALRLRVDILWVVLVGALVSIAIL